MKYLKYLKGFFLTSQKHASDIQLRNTESKTVQVTWEMGLCINNVTLFYTFENFTDFLGE